ncbi:MAG: hypothetical protein NXI04_13340 [Planctomycetaceae bacterium]|nr:hypothetical protein [Planctomycetaceae bacterium]
MIELVEFAAIFLKISETGSTALSQYNGVNSVVNTKCGMPVSSDPKAGSASKSRQIYEKLTWVGVPKSLPIAAFVSLFFGRKFTLVLPKRSH